MSIDDTGTRWAGTDGSLTVDIVRALAEERGCRPEKLQPRLYEVIDPDALEALFAPCNDGISRAPVRVVFEVGAFEVTVDQHRRVSVSSVE